MSNGSLPKGGNLLLGGDMKFNGLCDRTIQEKFEGKWEKGVTDQADYFTKHHPFRVHKALRHDYVLKGFQASKRTKRFDTSANI